MGMFNKLFNNDQQAPIKATTERPSPKPTDGGKTPSIPKTQLNPEIIRRAEEGDPVAQCKLGLKYKVDGYLIEEMSAMIAADGTAIKDFENLYNPNITSEQAYAAAFEWLSKSAKQQYGPAEYYLAQMYLYALGVEQSEKEYDRLIRESQKHSVIDLNRMDSKPLKKYSKNELEAMVREVENGNAQAMYDFAWAILQGNPVPENMPSFEEDERDEFSQYGGFFDPFFGDDPGYRSSLEIETEKTMESLKKVTQLLKMASDAGHAEATQDYNFLSMDQYVSKYGTFEEGKYEKESSNRQSWIAKNCANMDPAMICTIALDVKSKLNKYCTVSEPYNMLMMAANRGYSNAYLVIGSLFGSGDFDEFINEDESYPYERRDRYYQENARGKKYEEYLNKAVEMNNSDAMVELAYYLCDRNNEKEAFDLFERASKLGNAKAMYNLAQFYQSGTATQKSDKMAIEWYTKAAQAGYREAKASLSMDYGIQFKTEEQKKKEKDEAEYDNRFWR